LETKLQNPAPAADRTRPEITLIRFSDGDGKVLAWSRSPLRAHGESTHDVRLSSRSRWLKRLIVRDLRSLPEVREGSGNPASRSTGTSVPKLLKSSFVDFTVVASSIPLLVLIGTAVLIRIALIWFKNR
jgi:hypothetical protein